MNTAKIGLSQSHNRNDDNTSIATDRQAKKKKEARPKNNDTHPHHQPAGCKSRLLCLTEPAPISRWPSLLPSAIKRISTAHGFVSPWKKQHTQRDTRAQREKPATTSHGTADHRHDAVSIASSSRSVCFVPPTQSSLCFSCADESSSSSSTILLLPRQPRFGGGRKSLHSANTILMCGWTCCGVARLTWRR